MFVWFGLIDPVCKLLPSCIRIASPSCNDSTWRPFYLSKIFITFISCIPNAFMIRSNMLLQFILSSKRVITFYTQMPNVFMSRFKFNMHLQLIFSIKWFVTFFTWIPNVFMIRWFYCTNGIIVLMRSIDKDWILNSETRYSPIWIHIIFSFQRLRFYSIY